MASESCVVKESLPEIVAFIYGGIYFVCLCAVGCWSFYDVRKHWHKVTTERTDPSNHNDDASDGNKVELATRKSDGDQHIMEHDSKEEAVDIVYNDADNEDEDKRDQGDEKTNDQDDYKNSDHDIQHAIVNEQRKQMSRKKKFTSWFKDTYNKKLCYVPILSHLGDQMTDLGVMINFGLLYAYEEKNDINCEGINPLSLLIVSIVAFLVYRVVSGYILYQNTNHNIYRLIGQMLDLELFHAMYINYQFDKKTPNSAQRWLQSNEAALEAFPQTLIQLFYIVKVGSTKNISLIIFSFVLSLWTIISRTVSEDSLLFDETFRDFESPPLSLKCAKWTNWVTAKKRLKRYHYNRRSTFAPFKYFLRVFWRCCDILSRIFLLLLVWCIMGGVIALVVIIADAVKVLVFAWLCDDPCVFSWILKTPIEKPMLYPQACKYLQLVGLIEHVILVSLVSLFIFVDFNCSSINTIGELCPDYHTRYSLYKNNLIIYYSYYCVCAMTILVPLLHLGLLEYTLKAFRYDEEMHSGTSRRALVDMVRLNDYDGIRELIEFGFEFELERIMAILGQRIIKYGPEDTYSSGLDEKCFFDIMCYGVTRYSELDLCDPGCGIKNETKTQLAQNINDALQYDNEFAHAVWRQLDRAMEKRNDRLVKVIYFLVKWSPDAKKIILTKLPQLWQLLESESCIDIVFPTTDEKESKYNPIFNKEMVYLG